MKLVDDLRSACLNLREACESLVMVLGSLAAFHRQARESIFLVFVSIEYRWDPSSAVQPHPLSGGEAVDEPVWEPVWGKLVNVRAPVPLRPQLYRDGHYRVQLDSRWAVFEVVQVAGSIHATDCRSAEFRLLPGQANALELRLRSLVDVDGRIA